MLTIGSSLMETIMLFVLPERRFYRRAKFHNVDPSVAKHQKALQPDDTDVRIGADGAASSNSSTQSTDAATLYAA